MCLQVVSKSISFLVTVPKLCSSLADRSLDMDSEFDFLHV